MSDLGDIGRVIPDNLKTVMFAFGNRAQAVVSGTGATPGSEILVSFRRSQVATVRADTAGDWKVGGLNDGTYWASEIGALRAWLIEVAGATVTVTPQTGGGGGGDTIVAGYAWASIG